MNREIIFRGKRCDNGEWVYGNYIYRENEDKTWAENIIISNDFSKTEYKVHPDTVGQYTGLQDKNGNKIYEGDILRVKEFENLLTDEFTKDESRFDLFTLDEIKGEKRAEYISPVRWEEGGFVVSTNGDYFDMWLASLFGDMKRSNPVLDFEVIGNIHDNPELLKGGNQLNFI